MQNKIILCCKSQLACAAVILQAPDVEAFACRCLFHIFDENDKKVVLYDAFFHKCIKITIFGYM